MTVLDVKFHASLEAVSWKQPGGQNARAFLHSSCRKSEIDISEAFFSFPFLLCSYALGAVEMRFKGKEGEHKESSYREDKVGGFESGKVGEAPLVISSGRGTTECASSPRALTAVETCRVAGLSPLAPPRVSLPRRPFSGIGCTASLRAPPRDGALSST